MMNEELHATSALLVQSGALLVSYNSFINFFAIVQCKANPSLQCTSRPPGFQQHWRHLEGNYDLNSAFKNADRELEQKRTRSQFHCIDPQTL